MFHAGVHATAICFLRADNLEEMAPEYLHPQGILHDPYLARQPVSLDMALIVRRAHHDCLHDSPLLQRHYGVNWRFRILAAHRLLPS